MHSEAHLPDVSAGLRWGFVLASTLLLLVGVVDLGQRSDEGVTTAEECFADDLACRGLPLHLSYLSPTLLAGGELRITGHGLEFEVVGWPGPSLEGLPPGAKVSVAGRYLGNHRVQAERVMVHRYRRLKVLVGLVVLFGWVAVVGRYSWGRLRG